MVAAYKMGMVHERPLVVKRRGFDVSDTIAPTSAIEPGSVLEIREEKPAVAPEPADALRPGQAAVQGSYQQPA